MPISSGSSSSEAAAEYQCPGTNSGTKETKSSSGSDLRVITCPPPTSSLQWMYSTILTFILVHYLLWGVVAGVLLVMIAVFGGVIGKAIADVSLLTYIPTFCDRRERKLNCGWDGFRRGAFWHHVHRYAGMTLVRTHALNPSKKYIMGWHPHGILILSRLAVYGGYFEGTFYSNGIFIQYPLHQVAHTFGRHCLFYISDLFPGLDFRTLAATPAFYLPGSREITLWLGGVDASPAIANKALTAGESSS